MKINIPVRVDPDFKPNNNKILDLRAFFPSESEEGAPEDEDTVLDITKRIPDADETQKIPSLPDCIISPEHRSEKRRELYANLDREARRETKPWKYIWLEVFLSICKKLVVFLIERYQELERMIHPFETKHTEKQLYFLAISLPGTIRTVKDILLYYPLMSRTQRYKILNMRKDALLSYQRVYGKRK